MRSPGSGLRLALAGALVGGLVAAPSAGAVVLHDQLAPTGAAFVNSQNFETALNAYDDLGADDFVVPTRKVWRLERVEVSGSSSGATQAATANVFVFADGGTVPGAQLFAQNGVAREPGPTYPDLSLGLAGAPILEAGRYWLGVQANLTFTPGSNNWWWKNRAPQFGMAAAWRQPGDGFADGCTAFVIRSACPSYPGTGATPDQAFRLSGEAAGASLRALKKKAKAGGKLKLKVNVPDLGSLVVRSKQLKTARAEVTEIGSVVVVLKAKAKTRHALDDGERVRAKLKMKLSRPGEDPLKAKAKAKLKP